MSYELQQDDDYELDCLTNDVDDQIYNSDTSGYYYPDEFEEIELDE